MLDPTPERVSAANPSIDAGSETQPFEIVTGDPATGLILLCDHASNAIPQAYGSLGLPAEQLERHIAYDIGAAAVTRGLAAALKVPAILSRYSRLFIDLNRGADDPTLVMRISDGAIVPGNRHIDQAEIDHRIAAYHQPYHAAIGDAITRGIAHGVPPALLSVHSFTPRWKETERPWHITVLWDQDSRFPMPLLDALRQEADLCVDENEPYSGNLPGDCMHQHGTTKGLPHALIEIRQDLIATQAGQAAWVARLTRILNTLWNTKSVLNNLRDIHPHD